MTEAASYGEKLLSLALDNWHEAQLIEGEKAPDFWDDCDTGVRLAAYLWALGYRRIYTP